jgi:hypothetical protein
MIRRSLVSTVAAAFLCSALASQAALVGWWEFEEGVGPTTADQSAGGHTGTLGAAAAWSTTEFAPVPSGSTASIFFDGTDPDRPSEIYFRVRNYNE